MKFPGIILAILVLTVRLAATTPAGSGINSTLPSTATAEMPGLKVGDHAVDFTLQDSTGSGIALKTLLKKGKVAVAFVRSANWCPFCRKQLQDLQKNLPAIQATGIQLVAISYDSPATNAAAAAKLGLTFPLLSDVGSKVIDAYGIRNHDATGPADGIPHPVLFLLDQKGVIRVKLMRDSFRERPEASEIVAGAGSYD